MLPRLGVIVLVVAALAMGAVALADMAAFLFNEHPVAVDGQVKAGFTLKNDLLRAQAAQQQGILQGVHSPGMRSGNPAHINKNTFAGVLVAVQKSDDSVRLGRAEGVLKADVQIVVAEADGVTLKILACRALP